MLSIPISGKNHLRNEKTGKIISSLVNCNFAVNPNFGAESQTIELWKHLLNNVIKINTPQYFVNKCHGIL